jgi:hypothetical protein
MTFKPKDSRETVVDRLANETDFGYSDGRATLSIIMSVSVV